MNIHKFNNFISLIKENNKLEHLNQPDGISCGPTCLKVVSNFYKISVSIPEIVKVCGTNNLKGTTDKDLMYGMDYIGLDYEQFKVGDYEKSLLMIEDAINNDKIIILRTLIKGVKHWVVLDPFKSDFNHKKFYIIDSWLGEYTIDDVELDKIWGARQYDGFVINGVNKRDSKTPLIENIKSSEIKEVIELCSLVFCNVMSYEDNIEYLSKCGVDFNKSVKLVLEGEMIGCYLVKPNDIIENEPNGIEGIALAIKPSFRKLGYGEILKDWFEEYTKNNGYRYLWGQHLKGLNNKNEWLKRREIYHEGKNIFYTIKRFK
jgi:hypothetical protein